MAIPVWVDFEAAISAGTPAPSIIGANLSLQAGDLVIVFASHRNNFPGSESITGLGATWTKHFIYNEPDDQQVSSGVWLAQENSWTTANIVLTPGDAKPTAIMACVVRGAKDFAGNFSDIQAIGNYDPVDSANLTAQITTVSADNLLMATCNPRNKNMVFPPVNSLDTTFDGSSSSYNFIAGSGGSQVNLSVHKQNAPTAATYTTGGTGSMTGAKDWTVALINIPPAAASAPEIDVTPTSHNFGSVDVGSQSAVQNINVQNTGNTVLNVSNIFLTGTNPGEFTIVSGGGAQTVNPLTTHIVQTRFDPSLIQASSATLRINSDDADEATVDVSLSGTGTDPGAPDINLTPANVNFGNVVFGNSPSQQITIQNLGTANLTVNTITLSGTDASDFNLLNLPTLPATITPSNNEVFDIEFVSASPQGDRTAQIDITSDSPGETSLFIPLTASASSQAVGMSGAITDTANRVNAPNKSNIFYYQPSGKYWGVFEYSVDGSLYLWRRETNGTWVRITGFTLNDLVSASPSAELDIITHGTKAYLVVGRPSNNSLTFYRLSYSGGGDTWSIDSGFPHLIGNAAPGTSEKNFSLKIQNNTVHGTDVVYLFTYGASELRMNYSTNDGLSFLGNPIVIADAANDGLTQGEASIDSEAFNWNDGGGAKDYIGAFMGENAGGIYLFSILPEDASAGDTLNWVFEDPNPSSSTADDHVSIRIAPDGTELYSFNKVSTGNENFQILKRDSSGTWSATDVAMPESRPTLMIDGINGDIYLFTADNTPAAGSAVWMNKADLATLTFDGAIQLIYNESNGYADPNTPHQLLNKSELLISTPEEISTNQMWWGLITVPGLLIDATVNDGILIADNTSITKIIAAVANDSLQLADQGDKTAQFLKQLNDAVTFADAAAIIGILQVAANDGINLSDSAISAKLFEALTSDGINFSDSSSVISLISGLASEGIVFSDAALAEVLGFLEGFIFDGLRFSDSIVTALTFSGLTQDVLTLSDLPSISKVFEALAQDGIDFSDSATLQKTFTALVADGVIFGDASTVTAQLTALSGDGIHFSDVVIADVLGLLQGFAIDAISLSDQTTIQGFFTAQGFDGVSFSDAVIIEFDFEQTAFDSIRFSDAATALLLGEMTANDGITFTDGAIAVIQGTLLCRVSVSFDVKKPEISFVIKKPNVTFKLC